MSKHLLVQGNLELNSIGFLNLFKGEIADHKALIIMPKMYPLKELEASYADVRHNTVKQAEEKIESAFNVVINADKLWRVAECLHKWEPRFIYIPIPEFINKSKKTQALVSLVREGATLRLYTKYWYRGVATELFHLLHAMDPDEFKYFAIFRDTYQNPLVRKDKRYTKWQDKSHAFYHIWTRAMESEHIEGIIYEG